MDSSPGSSSGFGSGGVAGECFADSGVVNRLSLLTDANGADLSHRALQKHFMLKLNQTSHLALLPFEICQLRFIVCF